MTNHSLRDQLKEFLRRTLGTGALTDYARRELEKLAGLCVHGRDHIPSGIEDLVGIIAPTCCDVPHSRCEKCTGCGEWIPWHDFPSRKVGNLDTALDDVPAEHTASPEEAYGGPSVYNVLHRVGNVCTLRPEPLRRDELAEERARRHVREDGSPR